MPGVDLFIEQLKTINIDATIEDKSWVVFDFQVEGGTFANQRIKMAINVPLDFPLTAPSGIHFTPRLRPLNMDSGAIHPERSHPCQYEAWKENGEYWSRPFPKWNDEKRKNAQTYMAFVRQLWETS